MTKNKLQLHKYQIIVGKLCYYTLIITEATRFFTLTNKVLMENNQIVVLRNRWEAIQEPKNLYTLPNMISRQPVKSNKIFTDIPRFIGYHATSTDGVVGVWFYLYTPM